MSGAWEITRKELSLLFRDRRALAVLLAFPLLFITILGVTTGKIFSDADGKKPVRIAVVDRDGGKLADEFIKTLAEGGGFDVKRVSNDVPWNKLERDFSIMLRIPKGFTKNGQAMTPAELFEDGIDGLKIVLRVRPTLKSPAPLLRQVVRSAAFQTIASEVLLGDPFVKAVIKPKAAGAATEMKLLVLNLDQPLEDNPEKLPEKIIQLLKDSRGLKVTARTSGDAKTALASREFDAALVIAKDFSDSIDDVIPNEIFRSFGKTSAKKPDWLKISVTTRGTLKPVEPLLEQVLTTASLQIAVPYILKKDPRIRARMRLAEGEPKPKPQPNSPPKKSDPSSPEKPKTTSPLPIEQSDDGRREESVYEVIVPGYTVMFVFFLVNVMGRSFIQERDIGTFRRLQLAPISAPELLLGKTIPFFLLSIVQTLLLFLGGKVLFGMDWGVSPVMLLPVMIGTSLAATGLGLVVATLVKTDSQVSAYGNMLVICLAGLSGCFVPRDWLPESMQTVSYATPHAWALEGYDQLLTRAHPDYAYVWASCGVMVLFAIGFFVLGCWHFHRNRTR